MLLYISGSFPDNQEGIAAGAKVLLDAMLEIVDKNKIILLTTDTPIISNSIKRNTIVEYKQLKNWKVNLNNIRRIYSILDNYSITAIHMEYPGDLYGKTFLASFLPFLVKLYNWQRKKDITFYVRLHEFTRARLLRKIAIMPILWFADKIYVPAIKDRRVTSKFAGKKVIATTIGANINVVSDEIIINEKKTISYFGSVYPGKGIERMLKLWKVLKENDYEGKYIFKIIGDIGIEPDNHFQDYHKQVWKWIEQYGLKDCIEVTGYISDEEVSREIQKTSVATLPYEDGLTLRRGSFLAYLAHGIPIVTSEGDEEAINLFKGHKGVTMVNDDNNFIESIIKYGQLTEEELKEIFNDNKRLAEYFKWDKIAETFLIDYKIINKTSSNNEV